MDDPGRRFARLVILTMLFIMSVVPASARKMFPANRGSIALENLYADRAIIGRYEDRESLKAGIAQGQLVPVPITCNPRLPEFRRYVRPAASEFLRELDSKFFAATGRYLIVDSAVRSADVQRQVARHNRSAAPWRGERASSHERGTTFDLSSRRVLFNGWSHMRRSHYRWLLIQLEYYQAVGRIHVIEERACIHIMVREDYAGLPGEN